MPINSFVNCPDCHVRVASNLWSEPTCPKCGHHNAMLGGKCRDCGHVDAKYAGLFEYHCTCGVRFFDKAKMPEDAVNHATDPDSGYNVALP